MTLIRKVFRATASWRAWLSASVSAAIAVGLLLGAMPFGPQLRAEGVSFRDFPFLVYCEFEGIQHAYYFSRLDREGRAIYITPDRLAGMITVDGRAERIGGEGAGGCLGMTLEELRAAGLAFDLPR